MRRFITYLYHCDNGTKGKGAGFIRVDQRNREVRIEVHVRDAGHFEGKGNVYLIVKKDKVFGTKVGEMTILRGDGDERFQFSVVNMLDSGTDFSDVIGAAVRYDAGYLVSNWQEEECPQLLSGTFETMTKNKEEGHLEAVHDSIHEMAREDARHDAIHHEKDLYEAEKDEEEEVRMSEENPPPPQPQPMPSPTYRKIQLSQLRGLPPRNRHLCNNNFLIHSFYNYNYLILKKEQIGEEERWSLGVPGIYEQPEKSMAAMFGFTKFEAREEADDIDIKEGTLGAWFIDLIM